MPLHFLSLSSQHRNKRHFYRHFAFVYLFGITRLHFTRSTEQERSTYQLRYITRSLRPLGHHDQFSVRVKFSDCWNKRFCLPVKRKKWSFIKNCTLINSVWTFHMKVSTQKKVLLCVNFLASLMLNSEKIAEIGLVQRAESSRPNI